MKLLLTKGYDVNAQSHTMGTPLFFVVDFMWGGNEIAAKTLIAAHADLDASGFETPPALFAACYRGKLDIVKALVAAGAGVDPQCWLDDRLSHGMLQLATCGNPP